METRIDSNFNIRYAGTKKQIRESKEKTGILELKFTSTTDAEQSINFQLTRKGHHNKIISIPLQEHQVRDGSTLLQQALPGLKYKNRKELEKWQANPERLQSVLTHIAALNLQKSTSLEKLSAEQLANLSKLVSACYDKGAPQSLREAVLGQVLSKIKPQELLQNPKLLIKATKAMSALNLQTPTQLENLSSKKLKNLSKLLDIYNDSKTPKPLKNAISKMVLSKIEPQTLIKHPQLLQENLQLMSSLNLQTFVRGNLNTLKDDFANADTENLEKHLEELNTPEAQKNFQTLDRLIEIFKDSETPQAMKDIIESFFKQQITHQERKEFEELRKHPQLLQENLKLMSSLNLQTFVQGNLNVLQKDLANADTESLAKHLKELQTLEAKQNFKTLTQLLKNIQDPTIPQSIKNLIQSSLNHPENGITHSKCEEFEKLQKDLPVLLEHYPEQLKNILELQTTVRQANGVLEDIMKGIDPKDESRQVNTQNLLNLIKEEPVPPSKTDPKDLETDAEKMALKKYEEECKNYEAKIAALSPCEKVLWEANKSATKLLHVAFDKDTPPELRDLVQRDLFQLCRQENVYAMKAICGIPDTIISTLTTKGGPMVQDMLDEEKLRSEAHNCDVKTTGYILKEYNGEYVILKDGDPNAGLVDGIKNSIPQYHTNIKHLQEKISDPTISPQDKQAAKEELKKQRASLAETESKLRNLLAKGKKFHTREEALEVIAKNHEKNKDIPPTSDKGNFRFYEIHAENVKTNPSSAQDRLLYYNILDIEKRPPNELHADTIGLFINRYSTQLHKEKDPAIRKQLANKIEELIEEAQKRLPTMQRCAASLFIFNALEHIEKEQQAHLMGFTQNGGKAGLFVRDIPKMIAIGNAAIGKKEADKISPKGSDPSEPQNSEATVTA